MIAKLTVRNFHALSAAAISSYLILHLTNHVWGLFGAQHHIAFMSLARAFYRNPVVEIVLLGLLLFQLATGIFMVVSGWKSRRGIVAWLQAVSGIYLAFFLLNHTAAVLWAREQLNLDTNFYFAAAGFHVSLWPLFFAPYYALAVVALFTHVGCATYWKLSAKRSRNAANWLTGFIGAGVVLGLKIVGAMAGLLFPVEIPPTYSTVFD